MADDEAGKRKKSIKPKPGVIDLEATEIERETAPIEDPPAADSPDPLADEPPPEADDPDLFEAEPRSYLGSLIAAGVAGAAIALSLFVLLLASGFIPVGGGDAALGSRVAGLEAQIQNAAVQPAAPPSDEGTLRAEIAELRQEIETLRAAPQPAAAPAAADPALEARISDLAAQVSAIGQAQENRTPSVAFDQLAARVNELSAQVSAPAAPDPALEKAVHAAQSAAALAAVASLESAVARGAPYASALASVRTYMPNAAIGPLEAQAEKGLPSAALLAARLAAKLEKAPAPPSNATGFVDRLTEGARTLVRVKPVDGSVPEISADDPWSARNAVSVRVAQSDYAAALADWDKLDDAAKAATKDEADALKARLEAESALDALRATALAEKTP